MIGFLILAGVLLALIALGLAALRWGVDSTDADWRERNWPETR
jgi:nitrogen fixation-related uncharacterized protein